MPSMAGHPMWQAWEHTLDLALAQLPAMLNSDCPYVHSLFFEEQLTAFQVWLDLGIFHILECFLSVTDFFHLLYYIIYTTSY